MPVAPEEAKKPAEPAASTVTKTRTSFTGLASTVESTSGCVNRPAQTTREVADVSEEMRVDAEGVSAASQQPSAASVGVASSSEELAHAAKRLAELMQRLVTETP